METFQSLLTAQAVARSRRRGFAGDRRSHAGDRSALRRLPDERRARSRETARRKSARARAEDHRRSSTSPNGANAPTIAGAGFINFSLKPEAVARKPRELLQDDRLGVPLRRQPPPDRDRFRFAERRQADARRPYSQHRPRRRARADRRASSATTSFATITSATGARSSGW